MNRREEKEFLKRVYKDIEEHPDIVCVLANIDKSTDSVVNYMVETVGIPEVGQILRKMTVMAVGSKGDGIVKTGVGFIIFVKGAKKGETVDIKIDKVFDKYAFATVIADGKNKEIEDAEEAEEIDEEGEETEEDEDEEDEADEEGSE